MRCKLNGKYYTLKFAKLKPGLLGLCDWDERTITIHPRLSGELKLDVIIHELLHACQPDQNEDAIDQTATNIARVLTRLGYRQQNSE